MPARAGIETDAFAFAFALGTPSMLAFHRRHRIAALGSALLIGCAVAHAASPDAPTKPPPRLPPTGSETNRIPAGVDTGSPATSDTMPLGTPVPPTLGVDRGDQNKRSAAARAAARPARPASSASAAGAMRPSKVSMAGCAQGPRDSAPVALPGSGFTGSSAGPSTTSAVARPAARDCV